MTYCDQAFGGGFTPARQEWGQSQRDNPPIFVVAMGGPIRDANQDARSAPRRAENRVGEIGINQPPTRGFSVNEFHNLS